MRTQPMITNPEIEKLPISRVIELHNAVELGHAFGNIRALRRRLQAEGLSRDPLTRRWVRR